ncbi:MAG: ATP-binding cassette domain-containing protein [Ruminococcus sp.]|nr:ATP-binding cassette domain-containing protein [Ruminococcus sp.]
MSELEIKSLTKRYGKKTVLDNINLYLDKGVYGLLGANGAGKSTLLKLLTDNIKRTEGEILWNQKEILDMGGSYRKNIGYAPQVQGLLEDFTAGQFMRYIGALKGMKRKDIKEQSGDLLELVGLYGFAHKPLGSFSGGMKQRVMLAAAMLGDPSILILDEPTSGLDPEERIRLRNHIARIADNKIILLATHVMSDIECIAQRVIFLKRGRLIRFSTPHELTEEIREKVGEINGSAEDMAELMKRFGKGQMIRRKDGFTFRIAEEEIPDSFSHADNITLEDVYLFYAEGRE